MHRRAFAPSVLRVSSRVPRGQKGGSGVGVGVAYQSRSGLGAWVGAGAAIASWVGAGEAAATAGAAGEEGLEPGAEPVPSEAESLSFDGGAVGGWYGGPGSLAISWGMVTVGGMIAKAEIPTTWTEGPGRSVTGTALAVSRAARLTWTVVGTEREKGEVAIGVAIGAAIVPWRGAISFTRREAAPRTTARTDAKMTIRRRRVMGRRWSKTPAAPPCRKDVSPDKELTAAAARRVGDPQAFSSTGSDRR